MRLKEWLKFKGCLMQILKPYCMSNEDWFYYDEK